MGSAVQRVRARMRACGLSGARVGAAKRARGPRVAFWAEVWAVRGKWERALGWPWAALGRLGKEVWGWVLGFVLGFFFLSMSIYSLISNLNQTKVEFKYEFEFKPQSIKVCTSMNATTKFKPMINFNFLRNKN